MKYLWSDGRFNESDNDRINYAAIFEIEGESTKTLVDEDFFDDIVYKTIGYVKVI